jgi:predicted alpha/beta-hydrolase family hydrolase
MSAAPASSRFELVFDAPPSRSGRRGPEGTTRVGALYAAPAGGPSRGGLQISHGAGYHMESPFLERIAAGLVARGFGVLRFNYPYRERALAEEKRMKPVDPTPVLEATHAAALAALIERSGDPRPVLSGKSLGARIATHLAAKDAPCRGVALLGYPLHPARRPEKERSEHFAAIAQPALFLQGTRDELCDLDRLSAALGRFGGPVTLEVLETADHSFRTLKASGLDEDDVHAWILERIDRWERATFPA